MQQSSLSNTNNAKEKSPEQSSFAPVYLLLGLGLFSGIGLIAAWIYCLVIKHQYGESELIAMHTKFVVRSVWVSLLGFCLGLLLGIVFIGYFIFVGFWLWCAYRTVRGAVRLYRLQPPLQPNA